MVDTKISLFENLDSGKNNLNLVMLSICPSKSLTSSEEINSPFSICFIWSIQSPLILNFDLNSQID